MSGARRIALLALVGCATLVSACDRLRVPSQVWNGYRISPPVDKPAVQWERTNGRPYAVASETAGRVTLDPALAGRRGGRRDP